MRYDLAMLLLACVTACSNSTPAQQAQVTQAIAVAGNVDGALVPVEQPIIAAMGPTGATVANADALLVHPAVVAACAAINGTPVSATPVAPATAVQTAPATSTATTSSPAPASVTTTPPASAKPSN